ncbi:hypothetical protein [Halomonas ventosae]|uniref:Pre-peptidase n=1 Tax=Halomonas ventosae TaxID=229007 RepID=A0A2T0VQG9_9GAMM|nr:hypothetical protein [Halomonas ventosae]PRY72722.1 hypothetical protein BCL64_103201 [Halomonas ventosae]
MKQPIITASLLVLGLTLASTSTLALASEMQERFREEGRGLDLTGFFQAETDARSRSFLFGSPQVHDFTVSEPGTYLFESRVTAGYSEDYRIAAVLEDDQGQVIARREALGQNGGLALRQRLSPGDYILRVEAQRFGTRGKAGDAYSIRIAGLDDQGSPLEGAVSDGEGIFFTGKGREGSRSVFVRGDDAVATLGASAAPATPDDASAAEALPAKASSTEATASAGGEVRSGQPGAARDASPRGFETIVTDVKIRARGEVLTFDVAERGTIAITTSTYPTGYEDTYRIELEVLDENGRVVAQDAGEGFDGDVDLTTELAPGRYRIRVQGQKFGSAMTGVNNYELKVQQLDRR